MSDEKDASDIDDSEQVAEVAAASPEPQVPLTESSPPGDESTPPDDPLAGRTVVGPRAALGLAVLSGVLLAMAFAGIELWFLAFVAWVPLILAVRGQTPRHALRFGLLGGSVMVGIGFSWLTPMLKTFSGFPTPICMLFAAIITVFQGGRVALLTYACARAERRGWNFELAFAAAFALSELVYPLLFPWYFGASFHDHPLFMQTAELGGPILVSVVYVGLNLAIATLARARLMGSPVHRPTVVVGLTVTAAAVLFGALRMKAIDARMAASKPVKVGLIQANIDLFKRGRALAESVRLTKEATAKGAELVVWSEATVAQPFDVNTYEKGLQHTLGRRLGVPAVVGGVLYERLPAQQNARRLARYYNSAFSVDATGKVTGRYDKQFLLMFGEYLPLGDVFPVLYEISPHSSEFTPGRSFEPLVLDGHRLATMICYEDIMPSFVNQLVQTGDPDLLVNLTNDRWFQNERAAEPGESDTNEPIQHLALAKLRTIEHRMFLARVSNSGLSALVDANGRVVVQTGAMRPEAVVGEARYMRVRTLYSIVGNYPWWVVSALAVAAGFVDRRRKLEA